MKTFYDLWFSAMNKLTGLADGPSKGLITVKVAPGVKMVRRAGSLDRFILWEVWKFHGYDVPGFEIKGTDTVLDFGAQIGSFSVYAAKKARRGRVYSFEPFPENYKLLSKNKTINKLKNLKIFPYAVSDKSGQAKFFVSKVNVGSHSLVSSDWTEGRSYLTVKTTSLKDILRKNKIKKVDYLKMDIEGNEFKVLLSTPKAELKKVGKIVMEYHTFPGAKHKLGELKNYLEESGFNVKIVKKPSFRTGYLYAKKLP